MEPILSRLYAGEIAPAEHAVEGNPRYEELCGISLREMDAFTKKLDEETRQEFDKLMDLGADNIARDNGYEFTWATSEAGEDEKEFAQKTYDEQVANEILDI